jgi:hypothetical protein
MAAMIAPPGAPPERMDLAAITSDTAEGGIGAAERPQTAFKAMNRRLGISRVSRLEALDGAFQPVDQF